MDQVVSFFFVFGCISVNAFKHVPSVDSPLPPLG